MDMKDIQLCFSALCLTVSIFLAIPFNDFFLGGFQPVVDRERGEIKTIVKRRVKGFAMTACQK